MLAAKRRLVRLLRMAHAGERAAAYAYRGHARSVKSTDERAAIRRIESEEWEHRRRLGEMLAALGSRPSPARELWLALIGRVLGIGCFISGWFLPMYGAGKIERRNVHEYLDAAELARQAGHLELVEDLLKMAEVEWDHERYFRERVTGHPMLRWFPLWPPLPPRAEMRGDLGKERPRALVSR